MKTRAAKPRRFLLGLCLAAGCTAVEDRRFGIDYLWRTVSTRTREATLPVGLQIRATTPLSSALVHDVRGKEVRFRPFGATVEWSTSGSSGDCEALGVRFGPEATFRAGGSLTLGVEGGVAVVDFPSWDGAGSAGGGYLGLSVAWADGGGRPGPRLGVYHDRLSDPVESSSVSAGWTLAW